MTRRSNREQILAARATVRADLQADRDVDLVPIADAIGAEMDKVARKHARSGVFHQRGDLL